MVGKRSMKKSAKKGKKDKKKAVKSESKKEKLKEGQKLGAYQEQGGVTIPEKAEEKTPQPTEKKEKFLLTEDFVKGVLVGAIFTFIIVIGYVFLFLK